MQRKQTFRQNEDQIENLLCFCEYYNRNNERAHLLMCCCNCDAVDELCTSFLCCSCDETPLPTANTCASSPTKGLSSFFVKRRHLIRDILNEIDDRLRIPFPGGARKINYDFILALITILIYLYLGSISFLFSILVLTMTPIVLYVRFFLARLTISKQMNRYDYTNQQSNQEFNKKNDDALNNQSPKSIQIAYYIILNAFLIAFVLFNYLLYDELQITMSINAKYVFNVLLVFTLFLHVFLHYSDPGRLTQPEQKSINLFQHEQRDLRSDKNFCSKCKSKRNENVGHCPMCNACIYKRDHHCFWVNNCIGYLNHKYFILYLFSLLVFFLFSFMTIYKHLNSLQCKINVIWDSKIDDETSFSCLFDVFYSNSNRSILTLLFMQLISLVFYLIILNLQQFCFISIGLTQHQLFRISQKDYRFSLFVFIINNFSLRNMFDNWFKFLTRFRSKSDLNLLTYEHNSNDLLV